VDRLNSAKLDALYGKMVNPVERLGFTFSPIRCPLLEK
jgi:hypothetical protein